MGELINLSKYITLAKEVNTHPAKLTVLSKLLNEVFNVRLEELLPGVEKKVGSRILGVRGSIDLLYSSVIFEIKVDLERELDDAREKLKKYFQALLEARPSEKFVGIATDVVRYRAFIPVIENGVVVDVKEVSSIDISQVSTDEAILWLDSYIFSKPRIRPTANDLRFRFGPKSPTYVMAVDSLRLLWNLAKDEEDVKLRYELWSKSMEIVYGSKPEVEAFIDQTYLVTLVKLIVYLRLSGDNMISRDKMLKVLTGEYFVKYGIENLVEEDFFTWIIHPKIRDASLELVSSIAKELLRYDLTQIDEDFFKEIYQEIVERGQRHRIGEYYTPEWLVELVLEEVMRLWREKHSEPPRILDPACGSGTFLCNAIHMLKRELSQRGWDQTKILNFILSNIVGIDINPLAVTIARANYIIALGELLHVRKGSILLPIYTADSIRLPKAVRSIVGNGIWVYDYEVNGIHIQIPVDVARDRDRLSKVIAAFRESIECYRARKNRGEASKIFERILHGVLTNAEFNVLKSTLNSIFTLIDRGRDSIWVYMLSNIYMPIALRESKFDVIVGNPPWIAMRYVENKEYQDFLKEQVVNEYGLLSSDQVQLFTQMDTSTLFYCRCSDLYLRDDGIIAFVMPRSVLTGAQQHVNFRMFRKPRMKLIMIFDLEDVTPLFNVPSCVLISIKGDSTSYPVPARRYWGNLPQKNIKLAEALKYLSASDYMYSPPQLTTGYSYYYNLVKAGAALYPRQFYFIDFVVHSVLGINPKLPRIRTAEDIEEKEPWKGIRLEGNIEEDFIYLTLLGGDIVPFGYARLRPVVLPVMQQDVGYRLYMPDELRRMGYANAANWFEQVQRLWEERATEKSLKNFPRFIDRIDYQGLLTVQNPMKRYIVLYNTVGKNIASCVIDKRNLPNIRVTNKISITPKGFIAEWKTMFYETNDEMEAHYLCAILNSDVVNETIKPIQTKGLFGERDIVRRPFMLSIPKFDSNNPIHRRLAELSKICHAKVANVEFKSKSAAGRRKEAKEAIKEELEEINRLVSQLLNIG